MLRYPENTVWYIEARPWNDDGPDGAGFAHVDPTSRGSGVVVTFIRDVAGLRKPRSYLLTCAHVVRDSKDRLLRDIICYPPGTGYVRTAPNSRRCGTFPNAFAKAARVSTHSPCKGSPDPRPTELRLSAACDWVLLEIDDPSFYHQPSAQALSEEDVPQTSLSLLGYPFGAGTMANREVEQLFWEDGYPVTPRPIPGFRSLEHAKPGMLDYEGPEETRPGMSGGGLFDETGGLVGIHRSSSDPAMKRGAVLASAIARYLRDNEGMHFSGHFPLQRRPKWQLPAVVGTGLLVIIALWFFPPRQGSSTNPTPTNQVSSLKEFELQVFVRQLQTNRLVPVQGLKIGFESDEWRGISEDGETDANGFAIVKFSPQIPMASRATFMASSYAETNPNRFSVRDH